MNLRSSLVATVFMTLLATLVPTSEACMYAKFTPQHTLCIQKQSTCPITRKDVTGEDINLILKTHNMHRSLVAMGLERRGKAPQPQAANMLEMTWDTELARSAQKWTDQCKIQHDCLQCRQLDRFMVGQNIYVTFSTVEGTEPEWETAIKSWYNEVTLFNPSMIKPFRFDKALGHYTQVLWAATDKIGCGYAAYKQGKFNYKLYICDYGPAGNVINNQMYEKGSPCTACPDGSSCSNVYNGLCSYGSSGGKSIPKVLIPTPPPTPKPVKTTPIIRTSRAVPITTTTTTTTTTRPPTTTTKVRTTPSTTTTTKSAVTQKAFSIFKNTGSKWWKKPSLADSLTTTKNPQNQIQVQVQTNPVNRNRVVPIPRFPTTTSKPNAATKRISFANHPPFGNQPARQQFGAAPTTTEKISGQRILSGSAILDTQTRDNGVFQNNRQIIVPNNSPVEEEDLRRQTLRTAPRTTPTRRTTSPRTRPTVIECNFDTKMCPISRIGTALWLLKRDNLQGKYYDSVLRAGETTQLFIMDGNAIPINRPSCLSFNYRKFPVIGDSGISMEYKVHFFSNPAVQGIIEHDTGTDWISESMDIPADVNLSVISFKMAVPPGNPSRAYHISLDDIVIEEGACSRK